MKTHVRPASQPFNWVACLESDRQHDDKGDDEHMGHADSGRQRADVRSASLLRKPVSEPCIVEGREAQHQPGRRQDTAKDQVVGIFKTKRKAT
jgi:hypothetical protein